MWRDRLRSAAAGCLVAAAALALAGCDRADPTAAAKSAQPFQSVDLTGASYARDFTLTDHTGARRTLADYRGKVVVLFFGFTHCPDVCPTAMVDMVEVRKRLGVDGERVQVLFVTVDPERDTQDTLSTYVPSFDPSFVGLFGTPEQTAEVAREFKVFYQKVPVGKDGAYSVDHTAGRYVFDTKGRIRLLVKPSLPVDAIVADLKRLLA